MEGILKPAIRLASIVVKVLKNYNHTFPDSNSIRKEIIMNHNCMVCHSSDPSDHNREVARGEVIEVRPDYYYDLTGKPSNHPADPSRAGCLCGLWMHAGCQSRQRARSAIAQYDRQQADISARGGDVKKSSRYDIAKK